MQTDNEKIAQNMGKLNIDKGNGCYYLRGEIGGERGPYIATVHINYDGKNNEAIERITKANAEFICKAANNYSKLVEENQKLKDDIDINRAANKAAINIMHQEGKLKDEQNAKLVESNRELLAALERADTTLFTISNKIEDFVIRNQDDFSLTDVKRIAANREQFETAINNAKNIQL